MASPAPLRAGAGRCDITPDPAMLNWIDQQPYDGILERLFVRALVLDDGETRAALLAWELIEATERATAEVREAVAAVSGIAPERVILHATHTHSAPRAPLAERAVGLGNRRRLEPALSDPRWLAWADRLPAACATAAEQAVRTLRPATLGLARSTVPEWVFNRRPYHPAGRVETMFIPPDPFGLPGGMNFGPVDPVLTTIAIRAESGMLVALLCHFACHAVSVYSAHRGVSSDWPGLVSQWLGSAAQCEVFCCQGCAGDVVPARRGLAERDAMAQVIIERALAATGRAVPLPAAPLRTARAVVGLPLRPANAAVWGEPTLPAEVQAWAVGPLALVTLPGEPLLGLSQQIVARSPLPHTVVLGYSNGTGVSYVGLPGEFARGGYEAGAGFGTDECGAVLVESAVRLLHEVAGC